MYDEIIPDIKGNAFCKMESFQNNPVICQLDLVRTVFGIRKTQNVSVQIEIQKGFQGSQQPPYQRQTDGNHIYCQDDKKHDYKNQIDFISFFFHR